MSDSNLPSKRPHDNVDEARMSFGDHLEELRSRLIKAMAGVALATCLTLIFGKDIVEFICRPLWIVQQANGLQPQLQSLSPTSAFSTYMQISFYAGLILAMPWVLHQGWMFVVTGLYKNERRFVRLVLPISTGLFVLGVLFLYYLILPMILQFFVGFNQTFGDNDLTPTALEGMFLPSNTVPESTPENKPLPNIPILSKDPDSVQGGDMWVNTKHRRLMLKVNQEYWSLPLDIGVNGPLMQNFFSIDAYISFVLVLALGFGLAFETPIVVFFLAWTGLVPVPTMAKARRIIVLGVVFAAAIITPPDPISLILLAVPMYALFEGGLLAAKLWATKPSEGANNIAG